MSRYDVLLGIRSDHTEAELQDALLSPPIDDLYLVTRSYEAVAIVEANTSFEAGAEAYIAAKELADEAGLEVEFFGSTAYMRDEVTGR